MAENKHNYLEVDTINILFVCLGNICRSPTAHGVFESMVYASAIAGRIRVDSCGTGDWHIGHPPDSRASIEASKRGYDLSHLCSRQICADDFRQFDYILAMDKQNLKDLQAMCPADYQGTLGLFLSYAPEAGTSEVPDPYYGGDDGFSRVLDLVEAASAGLLQEVGGDYPQQ